MAYLPADAVELLRRLVVDVQALRTMYEADRQGVATGADAALVFAIFAVVGLRPFTVRELLAMASREGGPESALRALLGGRSPKAVGQALRAAAGRRCATGDLMLVRVSTSRSSAIWRVQNPTNPTRD